MLLQSVSQQVTENAAHRDAVLGIMQNGIAGKMAAHEKALQAEKERKAALDAAEKQARAELAQERLRKEAERLRIEKEQQAGMEWEQYQPPPPTEVVVTEVTSDDPPMAVLADGSKYPLTAEKAEELRGVFASLPGDGEP